jgi:DNA invertase Pin-like site-specific DNA recombinase
VIQRAAIYARVSSAAQRDRDTIAAQLRDLPAFVAAQGWTLAGTYVDDGTRTQLRADGLARGVASWFIEESRINHLFGASVALVQDVKEGPDWRKLT